MFTVIRNQNEFYPEQDVTQRTEDGREIVVARAGTPMPMAKARQLGLIQPEAAQTVEPVTEETSANKSKKPAETKPKKPAGNKAAESSTEQTVEPVTEETSATETVEKTDEENSDKGGDA